jgi:4-hydroxythreonine-4-phosphate dehydrogenase
LNRILLTSGDPAGIGPEVILKTFLALAQRPESKTEKKISLLKNHIEWTVIGSKIVYQSLIKKLKMACSFDKTGTVLLFNSQLRLPFIDVPLDGKIAIGHISKIAGKNAFAVLEESIRLIKTGRYHAIVTAPVSKEAIALSEPHFIGHTEYYAEAFHAKKVSMSFMSPVFDLVLMTTHLGIKKLSAQMKPPVIKLAIENALHLQAISKDKKPLVVMGFNPHASEGGHFGHEDGVIEKVIRSFKLGKKIVGPLAADSAFQQVYQGKYSTVVACYHDQGLIPLKMLSKGRSVNVTLGLPIVRTSVDHGTAFDIAGKGKATHGSMMEAMLCAARLLK